MFPPETETPAAPPTWFEQMMTGMGIPAPQGVFQELQRFNNNLERYAPQLQTIAGCLSDPAQIQDLTDAMREASNVGKSLLAKLK